MLLSAITQMPDDDIMIKYVMTSHASAKAVLFTSQCSLTNILEKSQKHTEVENKADFWERLTGKTGSRFDATLVFTQPSLVVKSLEKPSSGLSSWKNPAQLSAFCNLKICFRSQWTRCLMHPARVFQKQKLMTTPRSSQDFSIGSSFPSLLFSHWFARRPV